MAKQWKHTYSKFYNGETDDNFIPVGDKYLSSYNMEPVLHPRYLEIAPLLMDNNSVATSTDITRMVECPGFIVNITDSVVSYDSTIRTAVVGGTNYKNGSYLYDTSGVLKVYIFDATNIYQMNADLSVKEFSPPHAGGAFSSMSVLKVDNTILYAINNIVYQMTQARTLSAVLTIAYGSIVKNMYYFNDLLYVFTQIGGDTIIYQCSYDGTVYNIRYKHSVKGVTLLDAVGSGPNIYFITTNGLYQTDGISSQKIKTKIFSGSAKMTIGTDDIVYITTGTSLYRYGNSIPGFKKAFVQLVMTTNNYIACVVMGGTLFVALANSAGASQIQVLSARYNNTSEIITMPYDAGVVWAEKNINILEFSYELKTAKTGASIQIQIQTNLMELNSTSVYINLLTLSTLSNATMRCRIDKQQILTALASESADWQYARLKIIINGGDPDGSSRMQYSPKVYQDILIAGEFINDAELYL